MALLAEEVVEEWLRRSGFFTIRGIKLGVHEIDLLAVRHRSGQSPECRHLEVQASVRPVSYISKVPKALQREGRAANSAKRSPEELVAGVAEWVHTKFARPEKVALMRELWPVEWSKELVLHNVKAAEEVALIQQHGVTIIQLSEVVRALRGPGAPVGSASGGDFIELINLRDSAA
jgi:hypothetical protein